MKAALTSYSENIGYIGDLPMGPSIDVNFIVPLPSKFHRSELHLQFRGLDYGSLGISRENFGSDEWEVEIKLTRKPKPQTQTFVFK